MKVNGMQLEQHGSGFNITLSLWVGAEEELGQVAEKILNGFERGISHASDVTGDGDAPVDTTDKGGTAGEPDHKPASRRGRKRPGSAPVGGDGDDAAGRDEGSRDTDDAPPSGERSRRRGRRQNPSSETAETAAPVKRGRGQPKKEEKPEDSPTESASNAERRSRSRSTTATPAKPGTSPSKGDISDEDISKAATDAASILGAPAVLEILEAAAPGDDTPQLKDLTQAQRKKFRKLVDAELKKAGD